MADKEIKQWITIKGRHIPLFEGETKADAIKRLKEGTKKGPEPKKSTVKKQKKDDKPKDEKKKATAADFKALQDREDKRKVQKALEYAKPKLDKESYSWKEHVEDAAYECKLNPRQTKQLEHLMKAYAIKKGVFKEKHDQWKEDWKKQGFNYDAEVQIKKGLTQVHNAEDLLAGDNYMNKFEYKTKSDWLKEHSRQYEEDRAEWSHTYRRMEQLKDKYVDPEMVEELGRDLARTLVNEKDYPSLAELREKLDRIDARKKEFEDKRERYNDYFDRIDKIEGKVQRAEYGRPDFEEAKGNYPGFKTADTSTSYYNDLLKKGEAKVVEMTPEQYIKECAYYIFTDSTLQKTLRGRVGDTDTDKYAKMMREGTKFDTPYLNYKDEAQEGLHRAVAAYMNGIKKIPVVIVGNRR